jgi:hypothetical protein
MSETATTNYAFKKEQLGHPPRDTALGANLDAIDTTLKTLSDTIGDFGPLASAKIVVGNSEGAAAAVAMSGDTTVDNLGEVTIGAGKIEIANLEAALKKGISVFGDVDITETTVWKIEFPFKVTIDKVNTVVSVALSANETTVTLKNNGGTSMTNGVITIASAAAKGDVDTASPTGHNVIAAGEDIQLVSSGACSTGKVIVTIHYTRTA